MPRPTNIPPQPTTPSRIIAYADSSVVERFESLVAEYVASLPTKTFRDTRKDWEARFNTWVAHGIPPELKKKFALASLSRSYEAAVEMIKEEYCKIDPPPSVGPGRPTWYVHPTRAKALAQGAVIGRLLELAGDRLSAELRGPQRRQG